MSDHPLLLVGMILVGGTFAWLWLQDWQAARAGAPRPHALPGATSAPRSLLLIAMGGAVLLLALETAGEAWLGLTQEQSRLTLLAAAYTLVAALVEEIIFRGYLAIQHRGSAQLWLSIVVASATFAALHPFLWQLGPGGVTWIGGAKGWFSTAFAFVGSLWFYALRFGRWNPQRSLLPCFVAHLTKNLGVILVKGWQGFLVGGW